MNESCDLYIFVLFCKYTPDGVLEDLRNFISPIEARRMCRLLKTALVTSMSVLRDAEIETPDGIFIGTKFGMLAIVRSFYSKCVLRVKIH